MQINLADFIKETPAGNEVESILRSCVHCGFCLPACPTYQVLGNELDSPRGRIYLIKEMLEGGGVSEHTQLHLDRCLTCRSCETACPSGVRYGRLVDIGREVLAQRVPRKFPAGIKYSLLRKILPNRRLFGYFVKLGKFAEPFVSKELDRVLYASNRKISWPPDIHDRKMLVLDGCVQPVLQPSINAATARILDRLGISLIRASKAGCCGAISYHLSEYKEAAEFIKRNIDAWWPYIEAGAEALIVTASGCGTLVKDYGQILANDADYAKKAAKISALAKDISEVLFDFKDRIVKIAEQRQTIFFMDSKIAFHSPCSLQHGQRIHGVVESMLLSLGFELTHVPDAYLCCGSAGTYSILQPQLSKQLLKQKVKALESNAPEQIVTANIGCLAHLQSATELPVKHWVELVDALMQGKALSYT